MELFKKSNESVFFGNKSTSLYTWSDSFKTILIRLRENNSFTKYTPNLIYYSKPTEYNYSYTIQGGIKNDLYNLLFPYADNLYNMKVEKEIIFFSNLIDDEVIDSSMFHILITIFKDIISNEFKSDMEALYAPLTINNSGEFPLHCDLYIPKKLFNIFDCVSNDFAGVSIFISMEDFFNISTRLKSLPIDFKETVNAMLFDKENDNFNNFYSLLYRNPWSEQLSNLLNFNALNYKFERGEGYMLNDRKWMHGRTDPKNKISNNRVHRLIFNSNAF